MTDPKRVTQDVDTEEIGTLVYVSAEIPLSKAFAKYGIM